VRTSAWSGFFCCAAGRAARSPSLPGCIMSLRSPREFADVSLRWVQPDVVDRRDQRRAGDAILATLRWENLLGSLATGETAEGRWTLKRAGFLRPRVRPLSRRGGAGARPERVRPRPMG
jgi:hypothetical protein